jgi:hypothetical protein
VSHRHTKKKRDEARREVVRLKEELAIYRANGMADMVAQRDCLAARVRELEEALEFYADPASYFGIAFFADPPCGAFALDVDDTEFGPKPGAKARAVLVTKEEK